MTADIDAPGPESSPGCDLRDRCRTALRGSDGVVGAGKVEPGVSTSRPCWRGGSGRCWSRQDSDEGADGGAAEGAGRGRRGPGLRADGLDDAAAAEAVVAAGEELPVEVGRALHAHDAQAVVVRFGGGSAACGRRRVVEVCGEQRGHGSRASHEGRRESWACRLTPLLSLRRDRDADSLSSILMVFLVPTPCSHVLIEETSHLHCSCSLSQLSIQTFLAFMNNAILSDWVDF